MTYPQPDYWAISPLNGRKTRTDWRSQKLADRLLSLAPMEFQDPAVKSVGATAMWRVHRCTRHLRDDDAGSARSG
jgi:hypothetical protein